MGTRITRNPWGALLSLAAASAASASVEFGGGNTSEGWGAFTGTMDWSYDGEGSGSGSLSVTLNNTSPLANGGYLTGFAFNASPTGLTMSLGSGPELWQGMSHVHASPFPHFDFGAAINGNWLGGGQPTEFGIAAGDSATFVLDFTGDDSLLSSLSTASFFDGSNGIAFAARFRGFVNGQSDKVPGELIVTPVPVPLAMAGIGLVGLGMLRRRLK